jgi:hypothetical protein
MRHHLISMSRRRWRRIVPLVAACVLASVFVSSAQAVHDLEFQLDGDVLATTTTTVGGQTQTVDWDSMFTAAGATKSPLPGSGGFTAATFTKDFLTSTTGTFNTNDSTTFATGSKDTLAITPGWQCNHDSNVNSKIDIMNAYSAAYTDPGTGDQILYFSLERNSNAGDGNVGFWFLQDSNVACSSPTTTTAFTGSHVDGDLLIVSAFTNGGAVSTIDVYRWNGGANGSLGTTPVAHGVDCKNTAGGDAACATVNTGTISTPWLTANTKDGPGHTLRTSEFFEGGLNLTQSNLAGKCFNTFLADTRSSQSLTATLFDETEGTLGECTSTTTTTPHTANDVTTIPAGGTLAVHDTAVVHVSGVSSFNSSNANNLSFHLCGPFAAGSTTLCGTGGVAVGSQAITQNGTYDSANATITSAGRYCFRADFAGDSSIGVPASSDSRSSECFTIGPRQPTLSTTASTSSAAFGTAIGDTANLANTANRPGSGGPTGSNGSINPATAGGAAGGSITFKLYGPNSCTTLATGFPTAGITVNVSGDGAYSIPVASRFTPAAPGTYHWKASYTGDLPNTLSKDDNTACGETTEDVVVSQIPSSVSTAPFAYPQDSATITSSGSGDPLPAGGTVTFKLYGATGGTTPATALANCQAGGTQGVIYSEQQTTTAGHSSTYTTSNGNVKVNSTTSKSYYWLVTYATGDSAHTGSQSKCIENMTVTFTADSGSTTLFP